MGIGSFEGREASEEVSASDQLHELVAEVEGGHPELLAHAECKDVPNTSNNLERWQDNRLEVLGGKPTAVSDPVYATDRNFTGAPLPGYEAHKVWINPQVIEQLTVAAHESLQKELTLVFGAEEAKKFVFIVKDGYRPHRASDHMVEWAQANDPSLIGGAVAHGVSGHNREYTVDLTLGYRGEDGAIQEVWMGGPFDDFEQFPAYSKHGSEGRGKDDGSHRHLSYGETGYRTLPNVTVVQMRDLLKRAMANAGFRSYSEEWWHYTSNKKPSDASCYDRPIY